MLFNSKEFIFVFLPVVLFVFLMLQRTSGQRYIYIWLSFCSLVFYSWWNPLYSWLLVASVLGNFFIGKQIMKRRSGRGKYLFLAGICLNLGTIGYYKYSAFFLNTASITFGGDGSFEALLLPLGISFFTFQQLTYLVDAYRGDAKDYAFFPYATFVTFFPQLIAGPIVHHGEMMPQFENKDGPQPRFGEDFAVGISIFIIGCFKKVIIADHLAVIATPIFEASGSASLSFFTAWMGALAYTFQLYFDFSGYSEMAVGIARMFGIVLPVNFNSPYKSTSIIDFWRRWHITLSRFLRDYIYIPLGGNRRGEARRYFNLMLTMLIGGLWHGAGWTFVFWGFLHGIYLIINQFWREGVKKLGSPKIWFSGFLGWLITFLAVVYGWVFFRAESFSSAMTMTSAMSQWHEVEFPQSLFPFGSSLATSLNLKLVNTGGVTFAYNWLAIIAAGTIAVWGRNVVELFEDYKPVIGFDWDKQLSSSRFFVWNPNLLWAVILGCMFYFITTSLLVSELSEFLYFNF